MAGIEESLLPEIIELFILARFVQINCGEVTFRVDIR